MLLCLVEHHLLT
uniref:Uncharacterized protein n=1 Tax=Arundo donax TaxID=35708 RepID=A0A0A9EB73_ARUDO